MKPLFELPVHFDGATYEPERDAVRLGRQMTAVFRLMQDGAWRTPRQIQAAITIPSEFEPSDSAITARLRDLRKQKFGGHTVDALRRRDGSFEYRLWPNPDAHVVLADGSTLTDGNRATDGPREGRP
jgi:hypothetical protein